jgi:hypothetical protein
MAALYGAGDFTALDEYELPRAMPDWFAGKNPMPI